MCSRQYLQAVSVLAKMWVNCLGLALLLQSVMFVNCAFEGCDNSYYLDSSRDVIFNSPNYPSKYDSGTQCRTTFITSEGFSVVIECNFTFDRNPSACGTENFLVSSDSDPYLRGAESYCGTGSFKKESEFNKISIAFISQSARGSGIGGKFTCKVSVRAKACDCGWSQRGRIVGGTQATKTEYPSVAGLVLMNGNTVFCDGTIISSKTIITANHCVDNIPNRDAKNIYILVGYTYLSASASINSGYATTHFVSRIIEHPSYNPSSHLYDIALLKTTNSMQWSRGVGPICIPLDTTSTFDYYNADIIGWGTTAFGGPRSNALLKTTVTIVNCKSRYDDIQPSQICTYTEGHDACQFDSGGPVIYKSARQYLIGIISYGRECGNKNAGVNTRVTSYISWIRQNIESSEMLCYKPFSF